MTKHNIVPTHLAVKAMRDNGYKNAAYAIAELIDNAIQAGATQVELLCGEKKKRLESQTRSRIEEIAVLDNGRGMDVDVLRMALQFGNGTYLDKDKHTGIGRFGMGLPTSSISQARRVDVWSWQSGLESAFYSYIDLDEIKSKSMIDVPEPQSGEIPERWQQVGTSFKQTGTLVVWSRIDRCMWKTAKTIIDNSELLVGRIYRKFLVDEKVKIKFVAFNMKTKKKKVDRPALPNDPLYLMPNTSCPQPENIPKEDAIFQPWGEDMIFEIADSHNQSHRVTVRFSYAKELAREGHNPGDKPHGKHAKKNVGVSIIRADRELDLDTAWTDPSDPRERWWGAEIEFPPALDDIFGVTNNKQYARYFSDLAKTGIDSLLEEGQSLSEIKEILKAEEDPRLPLIEIANHIEKNIKNIRKLLRAQTAGKRSTSQRYETKNIPEAKATEATQRRQKEGYKGESDKQETLPPETRTQEIKETLTGWNIPSKDVEEITANTISRGYKYTFVKASIDSACFFVVKSKGGSINIALNTDHPAYEHLIELLNDDVEGADTEILKNRLTKARDGLELLLSAWARYEDEQPTESLRNKVQDARWHWGKMAREFLEGEE